MICPLDFVPRSLSMNDRELSQVHLMNIYFCCSSSMETRFSFETLEFQMVQKPRASTNEIASYWSSNSNDLEINSISIVQFFGMLFWMLSSSSERIELRNCSIKQANKQCFCLFSIIMKREGFVLSAMLSEMAIACLRYSNPLGSLEKYLMSKFPIP